METLTSEQKQMGLALLVVRLAAAACFLHHGRAVLIAGAGPYSLYYLLRPAPGLAPAETRRTRAPQG